MNQIKTISKKKKIHRSGNTSDLNKMIRKNPNLKTLIEKFDLELNDKPSIPKVE